MPRPRKERPPKLASGRPREVDSPKLAALRAQHECCRPARQAELLAMIRAQLPEKERALVGWTGIAAYLRELGIRDPALRWVTPARIRRWTKQRGFPYLRGAIYEGGRLAPGMSTTFMVAAWLLSQYATQRADFVVCTPDVPVKPPRARRATPSPTPTA